MSRSDQAGTGAAREVVAWLVQRLRFAETPVLRDVLAGELQAHAELTWGYRWSRSTAGRRLREAIRAAGDAGWPVVSEGEGFFLARTREQRQAAALRLRQIADDLLDRAARLEVAPVSGEQVDLFGINPDSPAEKRGVAWPTSW